MSMTDYDLIIPENLHGQRLDKALTALLAPLTPSLSRVRMQGLMAEGHVTFDGKPVTDASRKAKLDQAYHIVVPAPQAAIPQAQQMNLVVLYEDDDLLVIDKPAGMVVHPAPGNRDHTLVNALLAHCGATLSGIGGVARPGIVHRLDKDTSGLMVVAKHDLAHQKLSAQFADRSLSRTYQVVVWGEPVPLAGSIEGSIGRHATDRKRMAVSARGKYALTHYKTLKRFGDFSLLECTLSTGRTHQIRVHLAHIKHPVVGDPVYNARRQPKINAGVKPKPGLKTPDFRRQALHAAKLRFLHPVSGKVMSFTSDLPPDMQVLIKSLKQ